MKTLTKNLIKVGQMSIQQKAHPEYGTFGIVKDNGIYLTIRGDRGDSVLHYGEMRFWNVV
jgi:hypothetical protein